MYKLNPINEIIVELRKATTKDIDIESLINTLKQSIIKEFVEKKLSTNVSDHKIRDNIMKIINAVESKFFGTSIIEFGYHFTSYVLNLIKELREDIKNTIIQLIELS